MRPLLARAGAALVRADDAVRAAAEELSYAQAQFGLSATDAFTETLRIARGHLARFFELRKLLDDDIPETEPQQRQMCGEILQRCSEAVVVLRRQEEAFNARRGLEANKNMITAFGCGVGVEPNAPERLEQAGDRGLTSPDVPGNRAGCPRR